MRNVGAVNQAAFFDPRIRGLRSDAKGKDHVFMNAFQILSAMATVAVATLTFGPKNQKPAPAPVSSEATTPARETAPLFREDFEGGWEAAVDEYAEDPDKYRN